VKNDRLANSVLYLLNGRPDAGLTVLLKLLYFSDYHHYRKHLCTITGAEYVARERGPVIENYQDELDELERRGFIATRKVPVVGHPDNPKVEYLRLGEPDPNAFTKDELATLDEVLLRYGNKTGVALSDMSHEELAPWKLVWDKDAPGARIPHALFRWLDNYADEADVEMARERAKRPEIVAALAEIEAAN
jgi:uncharacterized phage-associated protein